MASASQSQVMIPSTSTITTAGQNPMGSTSTSTSSSSATTSTTPVTITSSIVDELMDENLSDNGLPHNDPNRWFFTKEQLDNTPSRRAGLEADKELMYRQQSANLIQDIGQRLQVNQLCINTAIVFMHRFFMYHSFTIFHRNSVSSASVFLAAKVEEQPRKLEYVIKVAHYCLFRDTQPPIDLKSEAYANLAAELVSNENILLQTLGFDVSIDHPHTHVVKCCQLVRASKDLAQTSYFMATNSLHLTTMCLEYRSSVVACVCIHLACKWSNWEIPRSKEGKDWFWYVDGNVTLEQLEQYTNEFLTIFNKSPSRLKKKIISLSAATRGNSSGNLSAFPSHFTLDNPSSPGMPQFTKSRSPSPSDSNAGKLRLPPKSSAPQPLFAQMRPAAAKPGAPAPHHVNKPHPGGSGGNHMPPAPPPPIYRQTPQSAAPKPHPVLNKNPHLNPQSLHSMGHGDQKNHQKQQSQFPPGGYHPSSSGLVQNSYPGSTNRPQPGQSSNTQSHPPSSSHSSVGPKPSFPPPAGNNVQHSMASQNIKPTYPGMQQQSMHPKPHHLSVRPPVPGQIINKSPGQHVQPNQLKRPYPTDVGRSENRQEVPIKREAVDPGVNAIKRETMDIGIKREPVDIHIKKEPNDVHIKREPMDIGIGIKKEPNARPSSNHMGSSQSHSQSQQHFRPHPPVKQEARQPGSQLGPGPIKQAPHVVPQQSHGAGTGLPPASDGRPWMDLFLNNEVQISQSQPQPLKQTMQHKPQLQVSTGLPPPPAPSLNAPAPSLTFPAVTSAAQQRLPSPAVPPTISVTPSTPTLPTPIPTSSLITTADLVGQEVKKKKEKKHKKDKHRDKDEKEHKHKDKHNKEEKKHKKEHKEKHKEKHKSKEKHRVGEDFSVDSGGNNKLKIIIGRNPNVAQESKDSNSKSSKHSKEHHTATIVNY